MNILETKNNLVKISYDAGDNLKLASFLIIEDEKTAYVAQILSLKADKTTNFAIVKLMFTFNEEGIIQSYDGSVPALNAEITNLKSSELLEVLPINAPLEIGNLAQEEDVLSVDYSMLEKNLLVCSEKPENTNILLKNFLLQLENNSDKSIVFDNEGDFEGEKLVFGKDFKLPLNYDTINYIYEHDLDGVDPTSKAIIQDIFLEIQEYSKTVLDKFIPFDTFVQVVDSQYKSTNLEELVLLKNKLLKYKEQNVFAQDAKDFQILRGAVRSNLTTVLDISEVEDDLQNIIISTVYNIVEELDLFVYSFVNLTNDNSNKKLIRQIISREKIYTTIICSHNYKYLYELKERANNMIFFAPLTLQHDFASYNTFLNKLNPDEFVIYGKATQNIPLIIELAEIEQIKDNQEDTSNSEENSENIESNVSEDVENIQSKKDDVIQDDFSSESDSYSYETLLEDTAIIEPVENTDNNISETDEGLITSQNISSIIDEDIAEEQETQASEEDFQDENLLPDIVSDELPIEENIVSEENFEQLPLKSIEPTEQNIQEITQLDENTNNIEEEIQDEEIITEIEDEEYIENSNNNTEFNSETKIEAESETEIYVEENNQEEIDNSESEIIVENTENLTEDDLNFIEDINSEDDTLPTMPIYPVNEQSNSSLQVFIQGDRVQHPKYGEGIVQKIVKYGDKNLCSINFVNVGIRLLDPSISELTRI